MKKSLWTLVLLIPIALQAQTSVPLKDLSFWQNTNKANWQITGDVQADLAQHGVLSLNPGTGILVNMPDKTNKANLISTNEYGDFDASFDFMMAAESNSGFYLQGRYEIQLMDSWGVKNPGTGDCGGIYKRRKFIPQEYLYEGHAPRVNACLAPGLWQHMEISFQAPRFDAQGTKIANAKVLLVKLNGAILHENVELTGPTGGPISEKEVAKGPIMIQGDHGAVAFRNMQITDLGNLPATMDPVSYQVFYGSFMSTDGFKDKKPDASGVSEKISWDVSAKAFGFAEILNTSLNIPKAGKHQVEFEIGGKHIIKLNGVEIYKELNEENNRRRTETIDLPAGKVALEITVYKKNKSSANKLGFWLKGPEFRTTAYHSLGSYLGSSSDDPILMDAKTPTIFRSFMDLYKNGKRSKRVVHAVNVGNPSNIHYTYDLDNGSIAQIWKGDFLNTAPMWDSRGDGSSRPRGAVLALPNVPTLSSPENLYSQSDVVSEPYKIKGYEVDQDENPTFLYELNGTDVADKIRIVDHKYVDRTLQIKNAKAGQKVRIGLSTDIKQVNENTYALDGKSYYIQAKGASIETQGLSKVLTLPATEQVHYSILW